MTKGQKSEYILMNSVGFENALLGTEEFKQGFNLDKEKIIIDLKEIVSVKILTIFLTEYHYSKK